MPLHSVECWHGKASVLILATTMRSIMIDANSSSNWSYLILEACAALSQRSQSDPRQPRLSVVTLMNHRALWPTPHKKCLYFGAQCFGRLHHNSRQYLECVGNAWIRRLLSVVGHDPAVRENRGSFRARRRTKQDDYVRQQSQEEPEGRSPPQTHT